MSRCLKKNCTNITRHGFRFCRLPDCGKSKESEEE